MPRRPRQHVLEDESYAALQAALPAAWLLRPEQKDYGIDASVEIVDRAGTVTGKRFFVQLKATDEPRLAQALQVRLKQETFRYYRSLDVPLLLVRYHAPSHAVYARWVFSLDPYYARRTKTSFTFTIDAVSDRWTDETPARLERDLDDWRWITAPILSGPLVLRLEVDDLSAERALCVEIARAVQHLTRRLEHLVRISEVPVGRVRGRVVIGYSGVRVFLPGGNSAELHRTQPGEIPSANGNSAREEPNSGSQGESGQRSVPHGDNVPNSASAEPADPGRLGSAEQVASDALIAVALALAAADHVSPASDLALAALPQATVIGRPEAALMIAEVLTRAGRQLDQLQAAIELSLHGWPLELTQVFVTPVLLSPPNYELLGTVGERLKEWIALQDTSTNPEAAGVAYYNVGRFLGMPVRDTRGAVHYLRMAARLEPAYKKRHYFWAELGGIFFLAGRLGWAQGAYAKGLSLGGSNELRGRRADALWRLGRYEEAQAELDQLPGDPPDAYPHWLLLRWCMPEIRARAGAPTQVRDPARAEDAVQEGSRYPETSPGRRACYEQAIQQDALLQSAWFNLGIHAARCGMHEHAMRAFLVAALIEPRDAEAWSNVIAAASQVQANRDETTVLLTLVMLAAYRSTREELYRELLTRIPAADTQDWSSSLRRLLAAVPRRRDRPVIRIHTEDGTLQIHPQWARPGDDEIPHDAE